MAEVKRMGYCIDGEWKQSTSDKYISITDSSTGEVIAEVPSCTVEECEAAIASAQKAFESWSQLSMAKRVQYMFRWRDVLYAHKEELAVLCAKELGKTLNEARGDVQKAIEPTEEACAAPLLIQGDGADLAAVLAFGADVHIPQRCLTQRPAIPGFLAHPLDDLIGEVAGVELGDGAHDAVQEHAARRLVDVFTGRYQPDAGLFKRPVYLHIVRPVASQAVELVDDDVVDATVFLEVGQHLL